MELIRTKYINKLLKWKDKNVIKIITGVRRCGKSTILRQLKNVLLKDKNIAKDQIIEFNFSDDELSKLDETNLYKKIIKKAQKNKTNYLFLDEVQEVLNY
jgi:predicted AAA+ superfamily ATPase